MIRNSIKLGIVLIGGIFIMLHYIIPAQKGLAHYGCKAGAVSSYAQSLYQSSLSTPQVSGADSGTSIAPQNC